MAQWVALHVAILKIDSNGFHLQSKMLELNKLLLNVLCNISGLSHMINELFLHGPTAAFILSRFLSGGP